MRISDWSSDVCSSDLAHPFVYDIGNVVGQEHAYQALCQQVGTPDIVVHNVGIRIRKSLSEATLEDILELINIDLISALHLSKLAAAAMLTSKRPGRFITVTSIGGDLDQTGPCIYPICQQGLSGTLH